MEARFSIHHRLISFSYPAYFKFSVTIGSLAFASSFPISGGFETAPVINVCSFTHNKRGSIYITILPLIF